MSKSERLARIRKYAVSTKYHLPFHQHDCPLLGDYSARWLTSVPSKTCYCGLDAPLEYAQALLEPLEDYRG